MNRSNSLNMKRSPESSSSFTRNVSSANNFDKNFEFVYQQEDTHMVVLAIREEIVTAALDVCYKNYLDRQSVKFMVKCAYKAFLKILDHSFYEHDVRNEFYRNEIRYNQDKAPLPSPPDSWASKTVPVFMNNEKVEHRADWKNEDAMTKDRYDNDEGYYQSQENMMSQENSAKVHIHSSDPSILNGSVDIPNKEIFIMPDEEYGGSEQMEVPNPSVVSMEDIDAATMDPDKDDRLSELRLIMKPASYFTLIASPENRREGLSSLLSKSGSMRKLRKDKKGSKRGAANAAAQATGVSCNDTQHPKNVILDMLPPIRAPTTFRYHVSANTPDSNGKKGIDKKGDNSGKKSSVG